jgi:sRNA-binding protein
MSAAKRRADAALATVIIGGLAELWPGTFIVRENKRRPLKLGIDHDLAVAAADAIAAGNVTVADLKIALRYYTGAVGYLRACLREGAERIDLNGAGTGIITAAEAAFAAEMLFRRSKPIPINAKPGGSPQSHRAKPQPKNGRRHAYSADLSRPAS